METSNFTYPNWGEIQKKLEPKDFPNLYYLAFRYLIVGMCPPYGLDYGVNQIIRKPPALIPSRGQLILFLHLYFNLQTLKIARKNQPITVCESGWWPVKISNTDRSIIPFDQETFSIPYESESMDDYFNFLNYFLEHEFEVLLTDGSLPVCLPFKPTIQHESNIFSQSIRDFLYVSEDKNLILTKAIKQFYAISISLTDQKAYSVKMKQVVPLLSPFATESNITERLGHIISFISNRLDEARKALCPQTPTLDFTLKENHAYLFFLYIRFLIEYRGNSALPNINPHPDKNLIYDFEKELAKIKKWQSDQSAPIHIHPYFLREWFFEIKPDEKKDKVYEITPNLIASVIEGWNLVKFRPTFAITHQTTFQTIESTGTQSSTYSKNVIYLFRGVLALPLLMLFGWLIYLSIEPFLMQGRKMTLDKPPKDNFPLWDTLIVRDTVLVRDTLIQHDRILAYQKPDTVIIYKKPEDNPQEYLLNQVKYSRSVSNYFPNIPPTDWEPPLDTTILDFRINYPYTVQPEHRNKYLRIVGSDLPIFLIPDSALILKEENEVYLKYSWLPLILKVEEGKGRKVDYKGPVMLEFFKIQKVNGRVVQIPAIRTIHYVDSLNHLEGKQMLNWIGFLKTAIKDTKQLEPLLLSGIYGVKCYILQSGYNMTKEMFLKRNNFKPGIDAQATVSLPPDLQIKQMIRKNPANWDRGKNLSLPWVAIPGFPKFKLAIDKEIQQIKRM